MPKRRQTNKRKVNKRILILCEGGKTEPYYFKGLKTDRTRVSARAALRIEIVDTSKNTGKELVSEAKMMRLQAKSERNPYDAIWIVLDKDGYTKHPHTFDQASANKINLAFSSISFEYWFLLHYEYTSKSFEKANDLIRYLKKYLPQYEKNDNNYQILRDFTNKAIENAKQYRKSIQFELENGKRVYELNPYTDVDVLVERLLSL